MGEAIFGHIGGKNLLGAELAALLPSKTPDIYIEPFGGSFGLGIKSGYDPNKVKMIHNDLDNVIHAIFGAVTKYPKETLESVYDLLSVYDCDQSTVDYFNFVLDYKDITGKNLFDDDINLGAAAWILKTITFNENCRHVKKIKDTNLIQKVISKFVNCEGTAYGLEGVETFRMDAMELLKCMKNIGKVNGKEIFIYIDAPYSYCGKRKTPDLYKVDIDKDDKMVAELARLLEEINQSTDCKIMASEYDNPIYNKELTRERGWEKVRVRDVYKFMSVPDRYGCMPMETEYIWRNYNEYGRLPTHIVETTSGQVGENPMESKGIEAGGARSKYKVEVSFLGTADDKQVEEEVVTILKGNFLAKMTSCSSESMALKSNPDNDK